MSRAPFFKTQTENGAEIIFAARSLFVIMILREGVVGAAQRRVPSQHSCTTHQVRLAWMK
jgi:hypothetical protein